MGKALSASQHPPFRDPCHILLYPYRKQSLMCVNPMPIEAWYPPQSILELCDNEGFRTFRHDSHKSPVHSGHLLQCFENPRKFVHELVMKSGGGYRGNFQPSIGIMSRNRKMWNRREAKNRRVSSFFSGAHYPQLRYDVELDHQIC